MGKGVWDEVHVAFSGSEEGEGDMGTLLRPAQPALLTVTRDGVMRVWVEVIMAPQRAADNAAGAASAPNQATPNWGASIASLASICQPKAGTLILAMYICHPRLE